MSVTVCQCRKCGKFHVFEKFSVRDTHICECGERIGHWEQRLYDCEIEKEPNEPYIYKKPFFGNGSSVCKDNESKTSKGLTKKVTIDVDAGKGFDKLLGIVKELRESLEDIPGLIMIDNEGNINAVPVISTDSKMIVFKTTGHCHKDYREKLAEEYTNKLGIKCEVIDDTTELAAVIDG